METQTVTVTWNTIVPQTPQHIAHYEERFANGLARSASATIEVPAFANTYELLNKIYEATNLYSGSIWDALEPHLPANRSHTAISIGDVITINGIGFEVAEMGWTEVAA